MTTVRISTATFQAGRVETFADFAEHVTRLVRQAALDEPDFLVFPEIVTAELASFFGETDLPARVKRLADYTDDYLQLFADWRVSTGFTSSVAAMFENWMTSSTTLPICSAPRARFSSNRNSI